VSVEAIVHLILYFYWSDACIVCKKASHLSSFRRPLLVVLTRGLHRYRDHSSMLYASWWLLPRATGFVYIASAIIRSQSHRLAKHHGGWGNRRVCDTLPPM